MMNVNFSRIPPGPPNMTVTIFLDLQKCRQKPWAPRRGCHLLSSALFVYFIYKLNADPASENDGEVIPLTERSMCVGIEICD